MNDIVQESLPEPHVSTALASLDGLADQLDALADRPLDEHVAAFEQVLVVLADVLATLDNS